MPDLSSQSLAVWLAKLPDDVREALDDASDAATDGRGALMTALSTATPLEVPDLVRQHAGEVHGFGRARRVRMMAWMANKAQDPGPIFTRLTADDTTDGEAGSGNVGILFLEDIKALAAAIAPRIARRMTSEATMEAVIQSAFTLEGEVELRQGGLR